MEPDEKIIKLLVDDKKVEKEALIGVFKIHQANKTPLEKLVIDLKVVKREDVLDAKAKVFNSEPYLINIPKINMEIAKNIPQAMAKRYNLICPDVTPDGKMIIAMHDPADTFALEYVQMRTGKEVKPYVALIDDLEEAWQVIYAATEQKKHPFFTRAGHPQTEMKAKIIPSKLSLPGLSKKAEVILEDAEKAHQIIKDATDTLMEKAKDDEQVCHMMDSINKELDVLSILSKSGSLLNSTLDEAQIITQILETGLKICKAQGASILILESDKVFLYFKQALGPKSSELLTVKIPLNDKSIAGWVALNRTPVAVNNVKEDPRHYREVDKMIDFETRNLICVPLLWGEELLGVMEVVNKREGSFNEKDLEYLSILSSQASVALHNAMIVEQFQNFYMEVVEILIDFLESLDPVNKDHALQVARLTSSIAKGADISEDEFENLCYAAFLHDIGKIKVTEENMKEHPVLGAQMLSHIKFFQSVVPLILHHHERYDGTGFPGELSGEDIPLGARILAISEGYLEGRHEKSEISESEYFDSFLGEFGSAYDPQIKEAFISAIEQRNNNSEAES